MIMNKLKKILLTYSTQPLNKLFSILCYLDGLNLEPISIIGNGESNGRQNRSSPNLTRQQTEESDVLSSGDDLPPPAAGKRKVIIAQRPNSFMWSLKVSCNFSSSSEYLAYYELDKYN